MFNKIMLTVGTLILSYVIYLSIASVSNGNVNVGFVGEEEKNIVYDFTADWCKPCIKMESEVWPNKRIKKSLESFKNKNRIKVDVDEEDNEVLLDKYKIKEVPVILITDKLGNELVRIVGFQEVDELKKFLDNWNKPQLAPEKTLIKL